MTDTSKNPLPVHILLCHRDVGLALICIGSLIRYCKDQINIVVHDDGTLNTEDVAKVTEAFRPTKIWSRADADERVIPAMNGYKACQLFRKNHPLAAKLIDIPFLAGDAYVYVDTDILFKRPFSGLDRRQTDDRLIYMLDSESTYSIPNNKRWFGPSRIKLPERVNTGLLFVSRDTFDFDLAEWFLSVHHYSPNSWHAEQTCWALHAARKNGRVWDAKQITTPTTNRTGEEIATHYFGHHKAAAKDACAAESVSNGAPVTILKTEPATYESLLRVGTHRAAMRVRGAVSRWTSKSSNIAKI